MKHKYKFVGPKVRVQLTIFDWPNASPPFNRPQPQFVIHALPKLSPKSTAYTKGKQLYFGPDPDRVWDIIQKVIPGLLKRCPRELREYLLEWTIQNETLCEKSG